MRSEMLGIAPFVLLGLSACTGNGEHLAPDACFVVRHDGAGQEIVVSLAIAAFGTEKVRVSRSSPSHVALYGSRNDLLGIVVFGPPDFGEIVAVYRSPFEVADKLSESLMGRDSTGFEVKRCSEVKGLTPPVVIGGGVWR